MKITTSAQKVERFASAITTIIATVNESKPLTSDAIRKMCGLQSGDMALVNSAVKEARIAANQRVGAGWRYVALNEAHEMPGEHEITVMANKLCSKTAPIEAVIRALPLNKLTDESLVYELRRRGFKVTATIERERTIVETIEL